MERHIPRQLIWTAMLPGGRRARLRLARGVRLCVGDILRIGRSFYRVDRRRTVAAGGAWEFVVDVSKSAPGAAVASA